MELDEIVEWLQLNKLSLNIAKSKFMIFHITQYQVQRLNQVNLSSVPRSFILCLLLFINYINDITYAEHY